VTTAVDNGNSLSLVMAVTAVVAGRGRISGRLLDSEACMGVDIK
jgi:hypothetical protein